MLVQQSDRNPSWVNLVSAPFPWPGVGWWDEEGKGGTPGALPTHLPTLLLRAGLGVAWSASDALPPTCNSGEGDGGTALLSDVCCTFAREVRRKELLNWRTSAISRTREGAQDEQARNGHGPMLGEGPWRVCVNIVDSLLALASDLET